MDNQLEKKLEISSLKEKFLLLGYSEAQALEIISPPDSTFIVNYYLNNHVELMLSGFTHKSLVCTARIYSGKYGGMRNRESLYQLLSNDEQMILLEKQGISVFDLLKVVSHIGGSKTLKTLLSLLSNGEQMNLLKGEGISVFDLLKVVSHIGGSKNLEALFYLLKDETLIKQRWKSKAISLFQAVILIKKELRKRKWTFHLVEERAIFKKPAILLGRDSPIITLQNEVATSFNLMEKSNQEVTESNTKNREVNKMSVSI